MRKLILTVLLLSSCAFGQLWSGVISIPRGADWSNPGVNGGIPTRTTICTTLSPGVSAATINAAIAACPAGQVVFLNAGTYNVTGIDFASHSNITLRGAGADQTFLNFSTNVGCNISIGSDMCLEGSNNWSGGPQHTANWTAGYAQGATSITLDAAPPVNQIIILDQLDQASDTGNMWVNASENVSAQEGPAGSERPGTGGTTVCTNCRSQSQVVLVTAVTGTGPYTVTISPGLYAPNWTSGNSPGAWWATTIIHDSGIEDMSLNHASSNAGSGVTFNNAYNCWEKGVRDNQSDRNHTWALWSARISVINSYYFSTKNSASESYGFEPYTASNVLFENNITQQVTTPVQVNGSASGSVFDYNYTIDNLYTNPTWMIGGCSLHAAGVDYVLFEGNNMNACIMDNIHGTHNFATMFRNRLNGWETGKNTQTNPFQIYAAAGRYSNIIANVLGQPSYHNHYFDNEPSGTSPNTSIYVTGWSGNTGTTGCCANDPLVKSTSMFWGNYDVVNAAVQWNNAEVPSGISPYPNTIPATHTLAPSFHYSSKPAFWPSTKAWPGNGPDVTGGNIAGVGGFANTNPAQDCASLIGIPSDGSGSIQSFNENTCYTVTPPTPSPRVLTTTID